MLKPRLYSLIGLLILNLVIWHSVYTTENGELEVHFFDVGQGDSIFIEAPNGVQVLIDGGPNEKVLSELSRKMSFFDRKIDYVLSSHPDLDHIGGLVSVLDKYAVLEAVEPGSVSTAAVYDAYTKARDERNLEKQLLKSGDRLILDGERGVVLSVLFPDRDVSLLDTNDSSLILRLDYGNTCFLFTGDAPQSIENYLVQVYRHKLDCDVLKAGHHGSKTSSSPAFVAAVEPEYVVISVGQNKYGHPNEETIQTFQKFGASILRTDEDGTITFISDGEKLLKKN